MRYVFVDRLTFVTKSPSKMGITAIFLLFLSTFTATSSQRVVNYNETEARILLNLAAGAYSTDPEICVNKTLPSYQDWRIYSTENSVCDRLDSTCAAYVIRSVVAQEIIVAFRGTKTKKQLLMEGGVSLLPQTDFYGYGHVNHYFSDALDTLWPFVQPLLADPVFASYNVIFTGHSLGAALASLAAARTVALGLRAGEQIKLVTYGQPRLGDYFFAKWHNEHIPYSFRLVHSMDIVPHMPACKKNDTDTDDKSKPCMTGVSGTPYHHGTEIWYPYGMGEGAEYHVCLGDPKGEDFDCSDSLTFKYEKYKLYIKDHRWYFDVRVPTYGKHGCVNVTSSEDDPTDSNHSINSATDLSNPLKFIEHKFSDIWRRITRQISLKI